MATAFLWTLSMLAWTLAGRRIGSIAVSFLRLLITLAFLLAYGGLIRHRWLPTDADNRTWLVLVASGVAGYLLSDLCAFRALLLIGPRRTLLLQSLSPPTAALISWVFLGETLSARHWLAMAITLAGITWVVLERRDKTEVDHSPQHRRLGVLLAVTAALAQATAMVLSRMGIGDYDAVAATTIRVLGALPGYLVFVTVLRRWPVIWKAAQQPKAMAIVLVGSLIGPVLGVVMCMIALRHCPAGIVTTIVSTMPVLVLPFSILLFRERVSPRAFAGAILSVAGVALMCWDPGTGQQAAVPDP